MLIQNEEDLGDADGVDGADAAGGDDGAKEANAEEQTDQRTARAYKREPHGDGGQEWPGADAPADAAEVNNLIDQLHGTEDIKQVGSLVELGNVYDFLSTYGTDVDAPATYDGEWTELPDGTKVNWRNTSSWRSGGWPTIDIQEPGGIDIKIHMTWAPGDPVAGG